MPTKNSQWADASRGLKQANVKYKAARGTRGRKCAEEMGRLHAEMQDLRCGAGSEADLASDLGELGKTIADAVRRPVLLQRRDGTQVSGERMIGRPRASKVSRAR